MQLSPCFGALFVADLIVGMEEINYITDAESDLIQKIRIATIPVRMVFVFVYDPNWWANF